jgi:adenylate cyclase
MAKLSDLIGAGPRSGVRWPAWLERLTGMGIVTRNPEVERRQRFTNVACLVAAINTVSHLIVNSLYDFHGLAIVNVYNVIFATLYLSLPALHRYGENTAAIALVSLILCGHMFVVFALGLASDLHIYFTLVGAAVFLFGVQNWRLFLVFFLLATAELLFAINYAPVDGFVLPTDGNLRDMLSTQAMINTIAINAALIFYALSLLRRAEVDLEQQYDRSEKLISAVLPSSVSARLKDAPDRRIADRIDDLSVMFTDLVGFTEASHDQPPDKVVAYLDDLVRAFEAQCEAHGVEKIKSIGDGCMAVAGLGGDPRAGAVALGKLALALLAQNEARAPLGPRKLGLRIGLHSGPAVAGVIGGTRFSYDVWGDAVNMAARMESAGEPGRVHVSEAFRALAGDAFDYEERGATALKGIGEART